MALIPEDRYPSQTAAADSEYPFGKARNVTVPGDNSGTPFEKDWVNDIWGFHQALLDEAGITPSGDPDKVGASDYLDALRSINTLPATQSVTRTIPIVGNAYFGNTLTGGSPTDVGWVRYAIGGVISVGAARAACAVDIAKYIPDGATITEIKARVTPSSAQSGANRMYLMLRSQDPESGSSTHVSEVYDDGTTSGQWLSSGAISVLLDKEERSYIAEVANSANFAGDLASAIRVTFTTDKPYVD